jgi:hypothetical protein
VPANIIQQGKNIAPQCVAIVHWTENHRGRLSWTCFVLEGLDCVRAIFTKLNLRCSGGGIKIKSTTRSSDVSCRW